jgi:2'-5' RNA ligase
MEKPTVLNYNSYLNESKKEEKKEQKYDYGCAMLYLDFPQMESLHEQIDPEDIYTEEGERSYGLEKEPHVTLLYGLHEEVDGETVKKICLEHQYESLVLENVSCFENEKFDVLKFDVNGESLHECNKKLSELPHTTDYPDYHPHATIGYLKPGTGKKYIQAMKDQSHEVAPHSVVYSMPSGEKLKWHLRDI